MSRRPKSAVHAGSCAHCGLSRRELMAGSAALALASAAPNVEDPVIPVCRNWIDLDTEHEALTRRWQKLETFVVRQHNWFRLSDAERQCIPEGAEMTAIEETLGSLSASRYDLLTRLPELEAATLQGACLKLSVAAASIFPDENPEAHALLKSTLDDLQRIAASLNRPG